MRWWKQHRWARWTVVTLACTVVALTACAGYVYYQIHTISLADIQGRHNRREQGASNGNTEQSIPSFLSSSVDKANELVTKPIDTQDALDVAAILLKSGLSYKEIYFLMGKSSDKLSNEEKQKIRELLLTKLTKEEIDALRSITSKYGKGLIILDPNYPIELVGVYDEAERSRIEKELDAKKAGSKPQPSSSPVTEGSANPTAVPDKPATAEPQVTPSAPVSTANVQPENNEKNTTNLEPYQTQIKALQASCEAKAHSLLTEIIGKVQKSSVADLQSTYLDKVLLEESQCEGQFHDIIESAQAELNKNSEDTAVLDQWKSQYEKTKTQVRSDAISQLLAAINK